MSNRYFYDLEFCENGKTIDLLSIGIVAEDGREYYAVNATADITTAKENPWLVANVLPHLPMNNRGCLDRAAAGGRQPSRVELEPVDLDRTRAEVKPKWMIAEEVRTFLTEGLPDDGDTWCELWADYAAYDHVGLAQLWGRMIDLPPGVPMFTRDIQQYAAHIGAPHYNSLPTSDPHTEHNALQDAHRTHTRWQYLTVVESRKRSAVHALRQVARAAAETVARADAGQVSEWDDLKNALADLDQARHEPDGDRTDD